VRSSALKALRKTRTTQVRDVIRAALKDPEQEVRIEALRYLSVYANRVDLPVIEDQLLSQSFSQLEPDEVKAWIMAYGHIGGLEAVSTLRSIVMGKSQLAGSQGWIRENSIRSLVLMGTPEALGALNLAERKHPELKAQIRALTAKESRR
jgi:HEAT repeat protein